MTALRQKRPFNSWQTSIICLQSAAAKLGWITGGTTASRVKPGMMIVLPVSPFLRSEERDLSRELRKVRLATFGKRRKCFARFAGLQTLAKQHAFPAHLSGDPVHVAHQRLGVVQ